MPRVSKKCHLSPEKTKLDTRRQEVDLRSTKNKDLATRFTFYWSHAINRHSSSGLSKRSSTWRSMSRLDCDVDVDASWWTYPFCPRNSNKNLPEIGLLSADTQWYSGEKTLRLGSFGVQTEFQTALPPVVLAVPNIATSKKKTKKNSWKKLSKSNLEIFTAMYFFLSKCHFRIEKKKQPNVEGGFCVISMGAACTTPPHTSGPQMSP